MTQNRSNEVNSIIAHLLLRRCAIAEEPNPNFEPCYDLVAKLLRTGEPAVVQALRNHVDAMGEGTGWEWTMADIGEVLCVAVFDATGGAHPGETMEEVFLEFANRYWTVEPTPQRRDIWERACTVMRFNGSQGKFDMTRLLGEFDGTIEMLPDPPLVMDYPAVDATSGLLNHGAACTCEVQRANWPAGQAFPTPEGYHHPDCDLWDPKDIWERARRDPKAGGPEEPADPNDCPECARERGPHYTGPCEHN